MSDYPNSGIMFKNDRKEKATHPDRKGSANIVCPCCKEESEFWVSGWVKDGRNGKFLSLAFSVKEPKEPEQPAEKADDDYDDDVPF